MSPQTFECTECKATIIYDPGSVIVSLNESKKDKAAEAKEVTAYLTCPNGHTKPYRVKK